MLLSDRADIISGSISITEARRESIDFATAHYTGGVVLLVRAADLGVVTEAESQGSGPGWPRASARPSWRKAAGR